MFVPGDCCLFPGTAILYEYEKFKIKKLPADKTGDRFDVWFADLFYLHRRCL